MEQKHVTFAEEDDSVDSEEPMSPQPLTEEELEELRQKDQLKKDLE